MKNLTFAARARLIVALLVLTGAGILALLWQMNAAKEAYTRAQEARYASYHLADELRQSSDDLTRLGRTYVVTGDPRWERQYFEVLDIRNGKLSRPQAYNRIYWDFRAASDTPPRANGETVALLDLMKQAGMSDAEFAKLAEAKANSDDLVRTETIAMNMVKGLYEDGQGGFTLQAAPDLERARLLMHDASYHANKAKIMKPVDEFFVLLDERTLAAIGVTRLVAERWQQALIAYAVVMLTVCVVLSYLSLSDVARGLQRASAAVQRVAEGHLDGRIEARGRNEIDAMLRGLQNMVQGLATAIQQVRNATGSITTASVQIAAGNQDLSARTEQTASNLQQTASSMEELTATVRQSADAARQANQLAASAAQIAARGGSVVGQVVTTMDEINHSSKKINDIIGVIDGIAFQTNILALNAAVEAARAGEQGRGFAVVAGEVRNLAQRSAEAAKEIKGLIGTSVDKVEVGSRLVADAGQTMNEIVSSVQRVSDIIGEITAAAGEQSDGIGQVNTAVNQLDQMTQQNAALVEQSAAAAGSLKDQASRLEQVLQVFRIDGSGGAPMAAPVAPTSARPASPAPARKAAPAAAKPAARSVPAPTPAPAPAQAELSSEAKRAAPAISSPAPAKPAKPLVAAGHEGDWESF